jgi:spoIIIJ-associated protein
MSKKTDQLAKESESLIEELLYLIGIEADIEITADEVDGEGVVNIDITNTDESGLLIGSRGSSLNAIQSFIALSLRQKLGEWIRVNLDIGNWKKKHEDYLINLAKQTAERARETGEDQNLYNLTPSQRRIIHMHLSESKDIQTESVGEGQNRYLVVRSTKK